MRRRRSKNFVYKVWFVVCLLVIVVGTLVTVLTLEAGRNIMIEDYGVEHEAKFGGVYIKIGIDDFNEKGFRYGDSVDVKFSNGFELMDIPYYNGYYVEINEPILIAYPGYEYVKVGVNYGDDLWVTAGLSEDDTATIRLNKREKYLKTQLARDIVYSDEKGETPDEVFGNFRNAKVGRLKEGRLYRSASPVDNSHKRAHTVDGLMREVGVKYIVNLSDGAEEIAKYVQKSDFDSPYFLGLYENGKVVALDASAQFKAEEFEGKLKKGFTKMTENEGPYLVHCVEGKDRTGYVMMVLEALAGASYDEIVSDYMVTYDNYYGINRANDPERFEAIKENNIDLMLDYMIDDEAGEVELAAVDDYSGYAKGYLRSIGMSEDKIEALERRITE